MQYDNVTLYWAFIEYIPKYIRVPKLHKDRELSQWSLSDNLWCVIIITLLLFYFSLHTHVKVTQYDINSTEFDSLPLFVNCFIFFTYVRACLHVSVCVCSRVLIDLNNSNCKTVKNSVCYWPWLFSKTIIIIKRCGQ